MSKAAYVVFKSVITGGEELEYTPVGVFLTKKEADNIVEKYNNYQATLVKNINNFFDESDMFDTNVKEAKKEILSKITNSKEKEDIKEYLKNKKS